MVKNYIIKLLTLMADFNIEYKKLILAEGGYVNDPDDSGGETYLGISRKNNPKWIGWKTIDEIKKVNGTKNITKILKQNESLTDSASIYYKMKYWDIFRLDEIPNQKIAHEMFDTCVNCGEAAAIRFAQASLGERIDGRWTLSLLHKLAAIHS